MFNRWKFIRRYATFRCRASFLPDNVKEKKRRKYYNIEYFSFNAKIRETVTSNGVNRKVNIKLHSRIYQRSRIYIYLLPHASFSLSLSHFYFHNGDKCDLRESHRSIRETKNVFERFERMRLENEKREKKTKTTMEIKTRSTVGTKREERKERGGWRRILGFTRRSRSSRRYRSILARRTLSSYLAFNDLSTHQIPDPPSLSPRIHCLSFFHVVLFPPVPRRDERAMPSKKPSLEQYFRADRRAPLA